VCVDQRRISEQADVQHPPRLYHRPVADRAAVFARFSPLRLIADAMARSASDAAKPVSLREMALGPANASVRITEYASMTCSHCAAFNANVFPKIKSEYIDTGKVRYVFREFPLDIKAAVASMLARCIAKDDAGKYFRRDRHAVQKTG
jgi:protein-disulfide isomerase